MIPPLVLRDGRRTLTLRVDEGGIVAEIDAGLRFRHEIAPDDALRVFSWLDRALGYPARGTTVHFERPLRAGEILRFEDRPGNVDGEIIR